MSSLERDLFLSVDALVDAGTPYALKRGVIPSLLRLVAVGFQLVLLPDPDDLLSPTALEPLLSFLTAQDVRFSAVILCDHAPEAQCSCRRPHLGRLQPYFAAGLDRARSAVVGATAKDAALARNAGLRYVDLAALSWKEATAALLEAGRAVSLRRATAETDLTVSVDLDAAAGSGRIATGIGFFDHMLHQLSRHGGFGLSVEAARGDLAVDDHHLVEDVGLTIGEALRQALGDRRGLARYGFVLPMDESRADVSIDLSGRPYLVFSARFPAERVGGLATEMVPHFFRSLTQALGATLHVEVRGENAHHMVEATFKGVARALGQALSRRGDDRVPSTKGVLA